MPRFVHALSLLLFLAAPPVAVHAETSWWVIDHQHTNLRFAVRHMEISTIGGRFLDVKGVLRLDEEDVTRSSVEVSIDVASIDTGDERRDGDLLSEDFLFEEEHPRITFRSTEAKRGKDGKLRVAGDLAIRGASHPVTLIVDGPSEAIHDPWGNLRRGLHATTSLDRMRWGVSWSGKLREGGEMLGNEVQITIDLELVQRSEEEARKALEPDTGP